MLLYSVCCTSMLGGQAVQPSLCMMSGRARCSAGMMLDAETACVQYLCVMPVACLQHGFSKLYLVSLSHLTIFNELPCIHLF